MHLLSRLGMLIHASNPATRESFTPGTLVGEIIEMVGIYFIDSHHISKPFIAALAMYQRARKLQDLINDAVSFASLAEDQLEAYNIAINSLSLVDQKNAWVLLPISGDNVHRSKFHFFVIAHPYL